MVVQDESQTGSNFIIIIVIFDVELKSEGFIPFGLVHCCNVVDVPVDGVATFAYNNIKKLGTP